jgi:hypothetical protein
MQHGRRLQTLANRPLTPSELRSTAQEVHNHHDHEEKIFFPWVETKVKLPPKMSADHKTLVANLDDVEQANGDASLQA